MKTTIVAIFLMASLSAASAETTLQRQQAEQQNEKQRVQSEKNLAAERARQDLVGKDSGAEFRLQRACTHALESGVANDVRRSYGCKN